ncbi:MAG: GNAT family N-acetyltransferase [Candidatus Limnocylindria bacterium]
MPTTTSDRSSARVGDLTFRPATLDDAARVADIDTALFPEEPSDPEAMRHWWASDDPAWTIDRFVIERAGRPIGFARHAHAPWEKVDKRYARINAYFEPAEHRPANRTPALDWLEARARADGAEIAASYAREDREADRAFLRDRGYVEERRSRAWELDLVAQRERLLAMLERSRARMREQGIRVLTAADDADPESFQKIHRMSEEAAQDVPTTIPHVPEPFEQFMKWFESPGLREDRMFIARLGDDVVGISVLSYPRVRGNVWTDWTGTARAVRGKGVARALKLETVAQAIALGIPRVRTENDGENAPILHLNAEMGYVRIPGWVQLMKPLGA